MLDAGHGGKDSGARGRYGTAEKNIVLAIAKRLKEKSKNHPRIQIVLTRTDDYFLPLRTRLKRAHQLKADLFIAIHADAYFNDHATGASVYALSKRGATSEAARWLAQRENYSELAGVELDALKDRSPMLRSLLIDLAQSATIRDSLRLGTFMLNTLDDIASLHHSHVEQAPFVVLKSPDIPSVLVEIGFISNPREEQRLRDRYYQEKIADALWRAIEQYVDYSIAALHHRITIA